MEVRRLTGPMGVNIVEQDEEEGARIIGIEPMPGVQIEIGPIPKELAHILGNALTMSDDDLREMMQKERGEAEAAARIIVPGRMNGNG